MSRELKFRVWNGMEMVYDVTVGKFGVFYVNPTNNGLDPNDSASITPFTTKYHEGTPVMQWTGLTDKKGKEIFEGDIVTSAETIGVIEYGAGKFGINWDYLESNRKTMLGTWGQVDNLRRMDDGYNEKVVVIGNVFENPDLLK